MTDEFGIIWEEAAVAQWWLYPVVCLDRLIEQRQISVKIPGAPVEIRKEHLRNIRLDQCVAATPTLFVLFCCSGGN
jgi:hypothetical protein